MVVDRWRRWSGTVRLRITLSAAAVVALGLVLTSVVLVTVVRRGLVHTVDTSLARTAAQIEPLVEDVDALQADLRARVGDELLVQAVIGNTVVASTPNVEGLEALDVSGFTSAYGDLSTPLDDESFRVLATTEQSTTIIVARSLDEVSDGVAILTSALVVAVPLLTLALAALVWQLVGRTLRPVDEIRRDVDALEGTSDLDRRVSVPETKDEIARLATTMNAMLRRVEQSSKQQQQFVADASHELRIPLTRLRTQLEVELPDTGDPEILSGLLDEVIGLQRLVEDLLYLARSDAKASHSAQLPVDLDEVIRSEALAFGAQIDTDVAPVMVIGDARQLGRAVQNLIENERHHARSSIAISLQKKDGLAVIDVVDDGPGIAPDRREQIFERFTRLDEARTKGTGGTGLGLAIVKTIVEAHAGTVEAVDADTGAHLRVRLPAES